MRVHLLVLACSVRRSDAARNLRTLHSISSSSQSHSHRGLVVDSPLRAFAATLFGLRASSSLGNSRSPISRRLNAYGIGMTKISSDLLSTSLADIVRVRHGVTMSEEGERVEEREQEEEDDDDDEEDEIWLPSGREDMLEQAVDAIFRAQEDGINRCVVRLLVPKPGGKLVAMDESFVGGIMDIYRQTSPLARDILMELSESADGEPPKMAETRLDKSGVDGESVWFAQASKPEDDSLALVLPTSVRERRADIRKFHEQAGPRTVVIVNPQWKDDDDAIDFLSTKGGPFAAIGSFLGGKGSMLQELADMKFVDVYNLETLDVRGSDIILMLQYPYGWNCWYYDPDTRKNVELIMGSPTKMTYDDIAQALIDREVPFRRDLGMAVI